MPAKKKRKRRVNATRLAPQEATKDPRKALAAIEEVGRKLRTGEKVV